MAMVRLLFFDRFACNLIRRGAATAAAQRQPHTIHITRARTP